MVSIEGRVEITVGDNFFACNQDAWHCSPCDINFAQIQVRVQPIKAIVVSPAIPFEESKEGEGHA